MILARICSFEIPETPAKTLPDLSQTRMASKGHERQIQAHNRIGRPCGKRLVSELGRNVMMRRLLTRVSEKSDPVVTDGCQIGFWDCSRLTGSLGSDERQKLAQVGGSRLRSPAAS